MNLIKRFMFPLFEVICLKNGAVMNLDWHQKRYQVSLKQHYDISSSESLLHNIEVPESYKKGLCKLRIAYNDNEKKVLFSKYHTENIRSLKIVEDSSIDYSLKYTDRNNLNKLYLQKGVCDDVLVIKNGKVTDSSYTNIVFYDGEVWVTPKTYLLNGTMRQRLLKEGVIIERDIHKDAIPSFKSFKLINAMRDLNDVEKFSTSNILF